MAHTSEPWRQGLSAFDGRPLGVIIAGNENDPLREGETFADREWMFGGSQLIAESVSDDDARRIIACVNACAGISTEGLERVGKDVELRVERKNKVSNV